VYEAALTLSTVIFIVVSLYYVKSSLFSIYHPFTLYCAFHGILFVLRPWIAWIGDYNMMYEAYRFMPSLSDKITVLLATTLGFLVFGFFSLRVGGVPFAFKHDQATYEERRVLFPIFVWVLVICGPIAAYSLMTQFDKGLEGMVFDSATGISINTTKNGYMVDAQLMLVSLSAVFAWINRFRLFSLVPLAFFVLVRAGTGGRGPFVAAMASAGLLYLYDRRQRYPSLRMALMLMPLLLLFRIVGDDRGASIKSAIDPGTGQVTSYEVEDRMRPLESMDYANMEFMEYLVYAIPQRTGTYDYFLDNLQIFTEPVPRVLWKNKPIGPPIQNINLMKYGSPVGMTRSLPGEGWYALGWLGVIVWSALYGAGTGLVYRKFVQGNQSTFATAAYMIFVPSLIVGFRDGALLSLIRSTGIYMIPIGVWYALSRFLVLPAIADMRRAMRRQAASPGPGLPAGSEGAPGEGRSPGRYLPPAVRRRRLALANASSEAPPFTAGSADG